MSEPTEETHGKAPGIAQEPPKRRRRRSSQPDEWTTLATICQLLSKHDLDTGRRIMIRVTAAVNSPIPLAPFIPPEGH